MLPSISKARVPVWWVILTALQVTFSFFMTMLGFSLCFVVAEVIPLFLITLFTVIAYDLGDGGKAIWLIVAQFISVGSIVPFVGPLVDLIGRKLVTLVSLCLIIVSMIVIVRVVGPWEFRAREVCQRVQLVECASHTYLMGPITDSRTL